MNQSLNKRIFDLLGGYPAWASDDLTKSKIEVLANRLFELGEQYQGVMIDARTTKTAIPLFIGELLGEFHTECQRTLRPSIEHYHLTDEFIRLLKLAEQVRTGSDVRKELILAVRNINLSKFGNSSTERKHSGHQAVIDDANKISQNNPRLSTSAIAKILVKNHPHYSEGRLRNILSPLKK
jgi:hypothetical protein